MERFTILQALPSKRARPGANAGTAVESPLGPPRNLGRTLPEIGIRSLGRQKGAKRTRAGLAVEIGTADKRAADEARRDPRTVAIARTMPTALIAPLPETNARHNTNAATWGVIEIGAVSSRCLGVGVKVAILDTGIDRGHLAFDGLSIVEKDFTGEGNGDRNGHGTHCAGTIFGRDVNGTRIGVAPGVQEVLAGKVLNEDGRGDTDMLYRAINWAIENNADVISMSLGFDFPGYAKELADSGWPIDLATSHALVSYRDNLRLFDNIMQRIRLLAPSDRGAVVVAAAGNESKADLEPGYRIGVSLPAAADGLISVGALQKDTDGLSVAPFSNVTPRVSAPGVEVTSAMHGTGSALISQSGTSMACPHVAGLAALWWQSLRDGDGAVNAQKVETRLLASARTDRFQGGVDPLDRGDGLVCAPLI